MAKKYIITDSDGENYICPYCDACGSLTLTIEAIVIEVPITPDGQWMLNEGICVEDNIVSITCIECGMEWTGDEIKYTDEGCRWPEHVDFSQCHSQEDHVGPGPCQCITYKE